MSAFLPTPPGGASSGPHRQELVEPRNRRHFDRARWSVQAARWQAVALAQEIFGGEVDSSMMGTPGREGFQAILSLGVPFVDLEQHREREGDFVRAAGADPVLCQVPLVFVFEPRVAGMVRAEGVPGGHER